jgi:hypothetical protein
VLELHSAQEKQAWLTLEPMVWWHLKSREIINSEARNHQRQGQKIVNYQGSRQFIGQQKNSRINLTNEY